MANAGYRSVQSYWLGGAKARKAPGAYRSILAYWMGGAKCNPFSKPPPEPEKEEQHAKGEKAKVGHKDSDIITLIPMFLTVIEEHG